MMEFHPATSEEHPASHDVYLLNFEGNIFIYWLIYSLHFNIIGITLLLFHWRWQ